MSSINRWPRARNFAGDILDGAVRFVSEPDLSLDLLRGALALADLRARALVFATFVRAMGEKKISRARDNLESRFLRSNCGGTAAALTRPFLCKLLRR